MFTCKDADDVRRLFLILISNLKARWLAGLYRGYKNIVNSDYLGGHLN